MPLRQGSHHTVPSQKAPSAAWKVKRKCDYPSEDLSSNSSAVTCLTQYLAALIAKWDPGSLRSCQTGTWCVKKRANGALVGGTYEVALYSTYLFPGSFPMIYEYPLHGVRGGAGAKSIHRSFASHPSSRSSLVFGAWRTLHVGGRSRQTGMNVVSSGTTQYQCRPSPSYVCKWDIMHLCKGNPRPAQQHTVMNTCTF